MRESAHDAAIAARLRAIELDAKSRARTEAAPRRPGVWSASRGNTARLYRQYCSGRAEDLGRLGRVNAGSGA